MSTNSPDKFASLYETDRLVLLATAREAWIPIVSRPLPPRAPALSRNSAFLRRDTSRANANGLC
jgi:hypothetical protein